MTERVSAPSRRWAALALLVVPILLFAGCGGSSDQFPVASPAVSSTCKAIDKYFVNQAAPQSELNTALKKAKGSGDTVLENAARAYQAAASALNPSARNEAFTQLVGRCQYFDIGPNETP
jgi:hypothetical protein